MDKGTFYTHALARLGDHNDVGDSDEHQACEMFAQHAIGVCLDYTRWTWATMRTTLEFVDDTATLPADCLRVQSISVPRYELWGRTIYAPGASTATLTYVTSTFIDTVTLPDYEPVFCEACILMLAAMMAPRLTNKLDLANALKQEAQIKLHAAAVKDARASNSNDQTPQL